MFAFDWGEIPTINNKIDRSDLGKWWKSSKTIVTYRKVVIKFYISGEFHSPEYFMVHKVYFKETVKPCKNKTETWSHQHCPVDSQFTHLLECRYSDFLPRNIAQKGKTIIFTVERPGSFYP